MALPTRTVAGLVAATVLALTLLALQLRPEPASSAAARASATDVTFVRLMTPHHLSGVKLGQMAATKGVEPKIKALGKDIVRVQSREAGKLRTLLKRFGAEPAMVKPIEDRDKADMRKLKKLTGSAFDKAWLDVISAHHSAAIQMASIERAGGSDRTARQLATGIVPQQSKELAEFNALVKRLG